MNQLMVQLERLREQAVESCEPQHVLPPRRARRRRGRNGHTVFSTSASESENAAFVRHRRCAEDCTVPSPRPEEREQTVVVATLLVLPPDDKVSSAVPPAKDVEPADVWHPRVVEDAAAFHSSTSPSEGPCAPDARQPPRENVQSDSDPSSGLSDAESEEAESEASREDAKAEVVAVRTRTVTIEGESEMSEEDDDKCRGGHTVFDEKGRPRQVATCVPSSGHTIWDSSSSASSRRSSSAASVSSFEPIALACRYDRHPSP